MFFEGLVQVFLFFSNEVLSGTVGKRRDIAVSIDGDSVSDFYTPGIFKFFYMEC